MPNPPYDPGTTYARFTGKFGDLKPAGWRFAYAFANRYRCYSFYPCSTPGNHDTTQPLRVWQHCGGYLEIADLFGHTAAIVEGIARGAHLSEWPRNGSGHSLRINDNSGYVKTSASYREDLRAFHDRDASTAEIEEWEEAWIHFCLKPQTIKVIEKMLDAGQLEITTIPEEL